MCEMSRSRLVCCHLELDVLDKAKGIKYDLLSAYDGTGNVSKSSFHPPGLEVGLGVLCCPGDLRVGASPFPDWGCGVSMGKARGCLCPRAWAALCPLQWLFRRRQQCRLFLG